ncbi:MAG: MotA/TolQ/ExbB proton channel family protein [Bdellovibrionales bacterium]|nr:MotA/TolQ/ExbB proton channel family protein [Bdellovibrionales bacterium]
MVERVMALYMARAESQRKMVDQFEVNIRKGEIEAVIAQAERYARRQPVANVVLAGAKSAKAFGGRDEIQSKMDEVLMDENSKLDVRIGFLAMLGNVGTLLGLLGTIVGLIQSFASVANVNAVEKAALLTSGIAMAMNTTAYGLIMAIPALVMYAILQNRANKLSEDLNQASLKAFNWLTYNFESVTPSRTTGRRKSSSN